VDLEAAPKNVSELKEAKRQVKERVYEQIERVFVFSALERTGWNITQAAAEVGMQRTHFHTLMRRYGIHKDRES
jgi:transcriptional regulator of acetoin/glycerol metabolism